MRRALSVLGMIVIVVGMGSSLALAEAAGFLHAEVELDLGGPLDWIDLAFELGAEYWEENWTFGVVFDVENEGLEDVAFLTTGSLGAFNVYSMLGFWDIPSGFLYSDLDNAVWTDLSGVELWGFLSIQMESWHAFTVSGAGLAFGGHGTVGGVEVWGEVEFNLYEVLPFIYWNSLESTLDKNLACDLITVIDPTCGLYFSFAGFYVEFPLGCADVGGWIGFECDGFYGAAIWVQDVAIGGTELVLEWAEVQLDVDGKDLDFSLGLDIAEAVCISPFVSLVEGPGQTVDGIEVDALELVCTFGEVTITASELLSDDDVYIGVDGAIHSYDRWNFDWVIPADCVDEAYGIEESIAIEVRRGGCCGGKASFGLYGFFDLDLDDVLFSWYGLRVRASSSISATLSLYAETWIWHDGIGSVAIGFDVTWGAVRSLASDWTCCLGPI